MGWLDGLLLTKTKEQTEKEKLAFERKIFPLGLAQRDAASAVLDQFEAETRSGKMLLFAFVCAKEQYVEGETPEEALAYAMSALGKLAWLKKDTHKVVLALLLLEEGVQAIEYYPTAAQLRQKMQELASPS